MGQTFFRAVHRLLFLGATFFFRAERDFALPPENIPRILLFGREEFFMLGTTLIYFI